MRCNRGNYNGELNACAIESYGKFYGLPPGCATLQQIVNSSAGVLGWAAFNGSGINCEQPPMYLEKRRFQRESLNKGCKARRIGETWGWRLGGGPRPFDRKKAEAVPKIRRMRNCRLMRNCTEGFRARGTPQPKRTTGRVCTTPSWRRGEGGA